MNEKELDHEVRIRVLERIAETIDKRFDNLEQRLIHLDSKMNNQFLWTLGIMITLFGSIVLHIVGLI